MKFYHLKEAASTASADVEGVGKSGLPALWLAVLVLVVSLFVFTGCDSGSSVGPEDSGALSVSDTSMLWAALYDGQFPLYRGEIPNSIPYNLEETTSGEETSLCYYGVSFPTLSVFLPPDDVATGAAVIICPGGGYSCVGVGSGGVVAEAFAENGIAAFVLKYRLPNDAIMVDKTIGPLQDAQEAIKIVRERAWEWNIDPDRVGIMGHSAGGHLAASAGVHYDDAYIDNEEGTDLRPSFMILMSSVISMEEDITHAGSRLRLLGDDPEDALVEYFSCELQVNEDTPPAWIAHAEDDTVVKVENSELFFDELAFRGVPASLNLYAAGGHSFLRDVTANGWLESLLGWLEAEGITGSD